VSISVNNKKLLTSKILNAPKKGTIEKDDLAKLKSDVKRLERTLILEGIYKLDDIDGNQYKIVSIGRQIWMAENLKTTHYANGEPIPFVVENKFWANLDTDAYSSYNSIEGNANIYGRLYKFFTVIDKRNVCPLGWHVPNDEEWSVLENFLGGVSVAGGKLKEMGTSHWTSPNEGTPKVLGLAIGKGNGFNGLPGGYRYYDGVCFSMGNAGYWWTSTEDDTANAWGRFLNYNNASLGRNYYDKSDGFSVRCVMD